MSEDVRRREIRDLLGSIVGPDLVSTIGDDDLIFEHGLIDSLHLIELIELLQGRFGFEIEMDELAPENFESLSAMARYVSTKTAA